MLASMRTTISIQDEAYELLKRKAEEKLLVILIDMNLLVYAFPVDTRSNHGRIPPRLIRASRWA
jgi:hypothetical protein